MPPSRSKKMGCAYRFDPESIASKPRKLAQPKKVLSLEEKEEAKFEKDRRKAMREAKKEWEKDLKAWVPDSAFRFPMGTMAMYKSDAKSAYSLTEAEILTLAHEAIPASFKTFYSQADVKELARRKFQAGASKEGLGYEEIKGELRLFKKTDNDNRRRRANFSAQFAGYVDPSTYRRRR